MNCFLPHWINLHSYKGFFKFISQVISLIFEWERSLIGLNEALLKNEHGKYKAARTKIYFFFISRTKRHYKQTDN